MNEIKIMVRVSLTRIKDGIQGVFDICNIQLGLYRERMGDTINGLVPRLRVFECGMPILKDGLMALKICTQTRVLIKRN